MQKRTFARIALGLILTMALTITGGTSVRAGAQDEPTRVEEECTPGQDVKPEPYGDGLDDCTGESLDNIRASWDGSGSLTAAITHVGGGVDLHASTAGTDFFLLHFRPGTSTIALEQAAVMSWAAATSAFALDRGFSIKSVLERKDGTIVLRTQRRKK